MRMQKCCIRILGVCQAATSVAHKNAMCHCFLMFCWAYPVEPAKCGDAALFIQIFQKKNINAEMLFTSKLKPSCSHRTHILRIF